MIPVVIGSDMPGKLKATSFGVASKIQILILLAKTEFLIPSPNVTFTRFPSVTSILRTVILDPSSLSI